MGKTYSEHYPTASTSGATVEFKSYPSFSTASTFHGMGEKICVHIILDFMVSWNYRIYRHVLEMTGSNGTIQCTVLVYSGINLLDVAPFTTFTVGWLSLRLERSSCRPPTILGWTGSGCCRTLSSSPTQAVLYLPPLSPKEVRVRESIGLMSEASIHVREHSFISLPQKLGVECGLPAVCPP